MNRLSFRPSPGDVVKCFSAALDARIFGSPELRLQTRRQILLHGGVQSPPFSSVARIRGRLEGATPNRFNSVGVNLTLEDRLMVAWK